MKNDSIKHQSEMIGAFFMPENGRRGVPCVRYADDIVLLAKSERAAKR